MRVRTQLTMLPQLLDPSTNSIGYLAVLDILLSTLDPSSLSSSAIDRGAVLDATFNFILKFEQLQVRYVGSWLLQLLERIGTGTLFSVRSFKAPTFVH